MPLPGFHYFGTICPEVLKAGGILVVPPGQRYNYHVRNHKPHFSRRYQAMRIILKLLAAPFVLALTLLVAVLNFAFSFASWVFCALSFLCLIGALFALFTGDRWGIQGLAAQGVSGRQVHKGVAGGSQRRGSVASPVMIGRSRNAAGNHPLSAGSPRQGATHYLQVVYSCALTP